MNAPERASLLQKLVDRGVLPAAALDSPRADAERPWYISIVLGAAGWLAGLFALLFVSILFKPDGPAGYALTGSVMLAAAFGLYYADKDSAFFDQLALAFSIAGQIAVTVAVADATESVRATAWAVVLLQAALLLLLPNRFAKSLATFFAVIALAVAVRFTLWDSNDPFERPESVSLAPALLGWFLVWGPLIALTHQLIAKEADWMANDSRRIVRPALTGLLVSLSIGTLASEPFGAFAVWMPPEAPRLSWVAIWPLLAVFTALFAAVCAYRLGHRALVGFAIAGALLHLVQFYFLLGITLLMKSCIMMGVGITLLVASQWLKRNAEVPS